MNVFGQGGKRDGQPAFAPPSVVHDPRGHSDDESWIDGSLQQPRSPRHPLLQALASTFAQPLLLGRRLAAFVATPPGVMTAVTLVVLLAIGAAGFSAAQSSATRQQQLRTLIAATEPVSFAAHNLYTSLSAADTAATTGFANPQGDDRLSRGRYLASLQRAAGAAVEAASGLPQTGSEDAVAAIRQIESQLPIYSGLVETARANARAGNPVGSAYLGEANEMMRQDILPAAATLFQLTAGEVATQQTALTEPQWVPLSGQLAALIVLVMAQIWLWRVTRRRLNKGLLTATVCMGFALLWTAGASGVLWYAGERGFTEAASPLATLTEARIVAQQARTDETLALISREVSASGSDGFSDATDTVARALDHTEQATAHNSPNPAIAAARAHLSAWEDAHRQIVAAEQRGDFAAAAAIALPQNVESAPAVILTPDTIDSRLLLDAPVDTTRAQQTTAAESYAQLDADLARLITGARSVMQDYLTGGLAANTLLSTIVTIATIAAMLAVALGMRARLQEYV
ncbi:hypothetical protein ACFPVT_05155 [Corynebacterium choanae]|uniref:Uncharacterized protein n=1 Tax=Corynebacterium choanae TaxID=1862358 RepID=A0A3G6J6Z1_9CORY|nr:hypothetical protein [Corynebacterium choanae]AZA12688.1 hypothetical protein CCHOA_01300 [Corynebacterium choanae]